MSTIEEDNKYDSLKAKLKGLPKVKAKSDFEAKLFARIREVERNKSAQESYRAPVKENKLFGWLEGLFRPSFIPAIGLTVVLLIAITVYFGYFAKNKNSAGEQNTFTSAPYQKEGEFVIYIKADKEYPKNDIASLDANDNLSTGSTTKSDATYKPMETPSDYSSPKPEGPDIRRDKVSEEQKFEMERSLDREPVKSDERKGDDIKDFKSEKKAPSNYLREKKEDINAKDSDTELQNEGTTNSQTINPSNKQAEDSVNFGRSMNKEKVISKSTIDSLKAKGQIKDTNEQKTNDKK
jgi:hypothetical protein